MGGFQACDANALRWRFLSERRGWPQRDARRAQKWDPSLGFGFVTSAFFCGKVCSDLWCFFAAKEQRSRGAEMDCGRGEYFGKRLGGKKFRGGIWNS